MSVEDLSCFLAGAVLHQIICYSESLCMLLQGHFVQLKFSLVKQAKARKPLQGPPCTLAPSQPCTAGHARPDLSSAMTTTQTNKQTKVLTSHRDCLCPRRPAWLHGSRLFISAAETLVTRQRKPPGWKRKSGRHLEVLLA